MKRINSLSIFLCSIGIVLLSIFSYSIFIDKFNEGVYFLFGGIMLLGLGIEESIHYKQKSIEGNKNEQCDLVCKMRIKVFKTIDYILTIIIFILITMQAFNLYFDKQFLITIISLGIWFAFKLLQLINIQVSLKNKYKKS